MSISEIAAYCAEFLSSVWNGIFALELLPGLSFKALFLGVFVVCFSIWIIHYFTDNTQPNVKSGSGKR